MDICFNLQSLNVIKAGDLLTYVALILAYIVYAWSVNRDLETWRSLFNSFKNDLDSQKSWLESEYFEESYKDKNSFDPYKIIFPLSFESLPEIIRRGVAEFSWISANFTNQISLFNERVFAFNDLLDHIKKAITANALITERLKDKLNNFGIDKESVGFDDIKKKVFEAKKSDDDFYLAEQVRRFNRIIHVKMIGNKSTKDKLHYLYYQINNELDKILENFDKKKPFFLRYKMLIIFVTIPLFICIELFFK